MVNQKIGNTLIIKVINHIRQYLNNLIFVEIFTPILQNKAGGANAKPFKTYRNNLKTNMSLRIAPELYLKQLVAGGMDRAYEIGSQFRNESIDRTHNPEFPSLEFYMSYTDYNDLMAICEKLLSEIVYKINGSYIIKYHDATNCSTDTFNEINFKPPFKGIDFMKELEKHIGESHKIIILRKC